MVCKVEVVIIGAGIIGMLTAKELLAQGVKVTLIDQSEPGREASWAGGGIVSPLYPWTYSSAITALASWAQQAYPDLVQELSKNTGIDPELNPCGLLMLSPPDLEQARQWASAHNKSVSIMTAQQITQQQPSIIAESDNNLWLPYVGNIRNPRLLKSLQTYLNAQKQCSIVASNKVLGVKLLQGNRVEVQLSDKKIAADKAVICAGAWSQKFLQGARIESNIEVAPVKGQMLVFEPAPDLIKSIILHKGKYLIPRLDGRIVVGSTLEFEDFNKQTSEEAKQLLLSHAYEMAPELKNYKIEAHWAGLRPGSSGGIPYIGKVPGWENLFINAGHFRNGLVLAPASARLMRDLLLGLEPIIDPDPYDPARPASTQPMH